MIIKKPYLIVIAVLLFTIILYALAGFVLLPYLIRTKLPSVLSKIVNQPVKLQTAHFNPFNLTMELNGFALPGADSKNLFSFEKFTFDINGFSSIAQRTLIFDSISLHNPIIDIAQESNGRFNFNNVVPKTTEPEKPSEKHDKPLLLAIQSFVISDGRVNWHDKSDGSDRKNETLSPISLSLSHLTTAKDENATLELNAELASGGTFQWQSQFSVNRLTSTGRINLEGLNIAKLWQMFMQDNMPLTIKQGELTFKTEYHAHYFAENKFALETSHGEINVRNLDLRGAEQDTTLLTVPFITIKGIDLDLDKRQIQIASVESKNAVMTSWLQPDGQTNFQALFDKPAPPSTDSPSSSPDQTWFFGLSELNLNGYQVLFTDRTVQPYQGMKFDNIHLLLQKFNSKENNKIPLEFSTVFNDSCKLKLAGMIALDPVTAHLTVDLDGLNLKNFQGYLDKYIKLQLVHGKLKSSGNLDLAFGENLQVIYQGNAELSKLVTRDKISNKDFLKWVDLQLQQIDFNLANRTVSLKNVLFDRPYLRFGIKKNRSTNFADIIIPQPTKSDTKTRNPTDNSISASKQPQTVVNIGKITLRNGHSDFSDLSLILPFVTDMDQLNGEIDGFSSKQNTPIKLALQGKVYDLATVGIKGSYQLKSGDSDITLEFSNMPLPLITPYMADFAGYRIEKGQMDLNLRYKVKKGLLEAQNKIFIDQLTLGDKVENPHATSLPLNFAIALLKNSDGQINLDFPITGSLDDPQFSVTALMKDVIINLVTKLVTSPFRALGELFDGDESSYSSVNFAPGKVELSTEAIAGLEQLGKALQNKPELVLDIKGVAVQSADWSAMRFSAVKNILKKMKSGELRDKGENIRSEYIELSDDEYKRLLAKFFAEVFPQEIDHTLLGEPRIKSQPEADFYEVARRKLEAVMQPDMQRLNDLAIARANAIAKYLTQSLNLDRRRIYILAPDIKTGNNEKIDSVLSLNTPH